MCDATWTFLHHPELLPFHWLGSGCGSGARNARFPALCLDSRQCLKLWNLLPQTIVEAKSAWLMGFVKRIRNLIGITRIFRINSKLNESFTRDVNPCISGHKPILGFSRKLLLVGRFFLHCLLVDLLPYSLYIRGLCSVVSESILCS